MINLGIMLLSFGVAAAVPVEEWSKNISGVSVRQTVDAGYIVAGSNLIKTDSSGNTVWNKTTGGNEVQQTDDGGYIVVNGSHLIKTDSPGNIVWDRNFSKSDYSVDLYSVDKTIDGGYIVGGGKKWLSGVDDESLSLLIKTSPSGIEQWNVSFFQISYTWGSHVNSVRQTSDGGYISTGIFMYSPNSIGERWIIKTNSSGNTEWGGIKGGCKYYRWCEGDSVQETSDGGYIMGGGGRGTSFIMKFDSSGNNTWETNLNNDYVAYIKSVQQTKDGGYIASGNNYSLDTMNGSSSITKLNSSGSIEWNMVMAYGARSVRQTSDGGYIVVGNRLIKLSGSVIQIDSGYAPGNGTTSVNITALNVMDLSNFDITLSYDPSVVNVTDANNNPVFGTSLNNLEQASSGIVKLITLNTGSGQSGDVLLSTLTFKAVGVSGQVSHLNLTENTFVNSAKADIPAGVQNGTFMVGLPKTGDINGNGQLTLVDAIYLAKHVGGFSGYEKMYADGDINANGRITLVDAIYLAKHVGGFIGYENIY